MKFRLIDVRYPGDLGSEELVIEALEDGDIGYVLVVKTDKTFNIQSCIWLPSGRVNKGDRIHVATSKINYKNTKNLKYISLDRNVALWSGLDDYDIVLIECKDWAFGYLK